MSSRDHHVQAARSALAQAMEDDRSVFVVGEDVRAGGPFSVTKGLVERFGVERVRDTPICEASFMGAGVGMALGGARPFIDLMFNDFVTAASDQLFNNAAKLHFMSGGSRSVPLTVFTIAGAGTRWGAHHSQHLEGWFGQVAGLKVLAPASPAMMRASVSAALADPDPVVVVADRALLYSRSRLDGDEGSPWQPRVVRTGGDVTLVATGRLVHEALAATADLDVSVEIVDLQRVAPLDVAPIVASVEKTSRLVIAHDEVSCGALSASVQRQVYEEAFWHLDGPIVTINSPPTPVPAAATLEDAYMISEADLVRGVRAVMDPG